jgi:PAS domain S-box-containing protein/putative nucleotidyltransferase with HDIG domain
MSKKLTDRTLKEIVAENADLRARLDEAEETLRAIRSNEVDALVVSGAGGEQIVSLQQVEEALRLSEEKYRTLVDEVNDGFFMTDNEGVFTFVNPAMARIYGVESPQALVGRMFSDFQASKEHAILGEAFRSAMQTGRSPKVITGEILRPDGTTAFIEFKPAMVVKEGRVVGAQGVVRDVTERTQAENALRESETEYRNLFENSVVGISQALPNGHVLRSNNAYAQMYGYANPEEMLAAVPDITQLYARPEDRNEVLRILTEKGVMEPREMAVVRRDGTRFFALVGAREIRDSDGSLRCYQAEQVDITARKQAEEELRQSEARFRILFEHAADVILQLEITPEGIPVIREANNATLRILGYERDELIGRPVSFIADESDPSKLIDARRQNILSGAGGTFETRHRCKDGTTRDFECSVTEMKVGSKTIAISVERDVTDRSRAVDRIRRQLEHLTAMSAIDRVIAANFDLLLSLSEILTHVTTELGMDAAEIMILNSKSQMLEFCVEHGFRTKPVKKEQIRLGEGFAGRAALEHHLVQVSNLRDQPENALSTAHWKSEEFVCYFGVPLISKGQVKGVLEVFNRTAVEPDSEWLDFLNALAGQTAIAIENSTLFVSLERSNFELSMAYDATIEGWSRALDLRDKETEGHTQRVTETTVKLARAFGLSDEDLVQVRWGALLHDIGKMGVPDGILHKPGPLTDEEWVAMRKHPTFAYEMLSPIRYLRLALDIPYCHHEKWDGSGYPRGLKGAQIPLIARIFAVVDVWDALRSDRPYRAAWPEDKVRDYIRASSGTFFDPQVVDVVMQNLDLFKASAAPN